MPDLNLWGRECYVLAMCVISMQSSPPHSSPTSFASCTYERQIRGNSSMSLDVTSSAPAPRKIGSERRQPLVEKTSLAGMLVVLVLCKHTATSTRERDPTLFTSILRLSTHDYLFAAVALHRVHHLHTSIP